MWSYYGSKSRIVELYPAPIHDSVIEPFAGSARYSLRHFDRDITLVDKYKVIIDIWRWLQQCSESDILSLPTMKKGQSVSSYGLCEPATMFLGMMAATASISPRNKVSAFSAERNGAKNQWKRIASQLYKIRHWKLIHGSYADMPNKKATWFIDPPYQFGGHAYVFGTGQLDFTHLKNYIETRMGQVIVCENTKADWMDFSPLAKSRGANQLHTMEAIWTNYKTDLSNIQATLF